MYVFILQIYFRNHESGIKWFYKLSLYQGHKTWITFFISSNLHVWFRNYKSFCFYRTPDDDINSCITIPYTVIQVYSFNSEWNYDLKLKFWSLVDIFPRSNFTSISRSDKSLETSARLFLIFVHFALIAPPPPSFTPSPLTCS